jgi:hypothetical protein
VTAAWAEPRAPRLWPADVGPVETWCDRHAPLEAAPKASRQLQRAVLRAIAWHVDRWGQGAYASVERLVERSGVSEAGVHRARRALVAAGRITVTDRPGRGTANAFVVVVGTGVTVTPVTAVPGCQGDTRSAVPEHDRPRTVTPEVVDLLGSIEVPPDPPRADDEPPAAAPSSGAAPGGAAGPRSGVSCMRAARRGRLCESCRACGTNPRAAAREAARPARRPRMTECASCQAPLRSAEPDPVYCRGCGQPPGWEQAQLGQAGSGPVSDVRDGLQDGQGRPPAPRSGPYGPGGGA